MRAVLSISLAWCVLAAGAAGADPSTDAMIAGARQFLLRSFSQAGPCRQEYPPENIRYGGKTALAVTALLQSGLEPKDDPRLARAVDWLVGAELAGVYAVSFRIEAMALLDNPTATTRMRKDVDWLLDAIGPDGAYSYQPNPPAGQYDNSNTHLATMALWSADRAGADIPAQLWKRLRRHWLAQQADDGGWGYRVLQRGELRVAKAYGSMTAAGVASLAACHERLDRPDTVGRGEQLLLARQADGLDWLGREFSAQYNPRKGPEHYHYWLFALQRAARGTGRKYLAGHDWFAAVRDTLATMQIEDGSWGLGDRIEPTAFALLCLARGREPTWLAKLQYPGPWNSYPADAANLSARLGETFERDLGWFVTDLSPDLATLEDGRVLYLTGRGAVNFTDEQVDILRQFVLRGGTIFSLSVENDAAFTMTMHRTAQRLFPTFRMRRVEPDDPLRTVQFKDAARPGLRVVSNNIRPLLIHCPQDIAINLQQGRGEAFDRASGLLGNIYLYLTDRGSPDPRGDAHWPEALPPRKPGRAVRLARLRYEGNWNPEPLAVRRLAMVLGDAGLALETRELTSEQLDASEWPLLHITGTEPWKASRELDEALRGYLASGGTLLADAAGGSEPFAQSFRQWLESLGEVVLLPLDAEAVRTGPFDLDRVTYRPALAARLEGTRRRELQLEAVYKDNRPVVLFSRYDITAGQIGYPLLGLDGYSPNTARQLLANLTATLGAPPAATSQATQPAEAASQVGLDEPVGDAAD